MGAKAPSDRAYATALRKYADPAGYPTLARLARTGVFEQEEQPAAGPESGGTGGSYDDSEAFAFVIGFPLRLFLDGIERYVATR